MTQRELKNHLQLVDLGTTALSGTTPGASAWADTRGFDSCLIVVLTNTVTDAGAAAGITVEIQESDTTAAADATAVGDDELEGLESALSVLLDTSDNVIMGAIAYLGDARYVRANYTGTSGTDAGVRTIAVLGHAHIGPPTLVGTSVAAT